LAQVDSAIGGKTAVDLEEGKNLVGAFYQPSLVFSDVALLKSLDIRQVRTGLAEIIKYGVIKDAAFFSYLENNLKSILKLNPKILEFIVARSSKIKAEIVSIDEREEKGIRTILNFGHTIGHAIEAATGYRRYTHGEAVSLGMLVALDISEELGFISKSLLKRVESLIESAGLPLVIKSVSLKSILSASQRDKKFIGAKNKFVLVTGLGKTKIVENLSLRIVKQAIKRRLG
jgi:3-dehydroquinate synthase